MPHSIGRRVIHRGGKIADAVIELYVDYAVVTVGHRQIRIRIAVEIVGDHEPGVVAGFDQDRSGEGAAALPPQHGEGMQSPVPGHQIDVRIPVVVAGGQRVDGMGRVVDDRGGEGAVAVAECGNYFIIIIVIRQQIRLSIAVDVVRQDEGEIVAGHDHLRFGENAEGIAQGHGNFIGIPAGEDQVAQAVVVQIRHGQKVHRDVAVIHLRRSKNDFSPRR